MALIQGTTADEIIRGTNGDDTIYGDGMNITTSGSGTGNDTIYGYEGNDLIYGGIGSNVIYGGDGNDRIYAANLDTYNTAGPSTLFGDAGNDTIQGAAKDDYIDGGIGNDHLSGGHGNDLILGGTGDDYISGGEGNDYLLGEAGADTIIGGNGQDTVSFETSSTGITLSLADSTLNTGDAAGDVYEDIEVFFGTAFNDTMVADNSGVMFASFQGNDFLNGGNGNDYFDGGTGDDAFLGNGGTDTLVGGAGNDVYGVTASSGFDIIVENANEGTDTILFRNDVQQIGLAKNGNDLIFFVNNDSSTAAVVANWFVNQAVEYVQLQNGPTYSVQDLVNAYIPSANAVGNVESLMNLNAQELSLDAFQSVQIDFETLPSVEFAGVEQATIDMMF